MSCDRRFTTHERLAANELKVVKAHGRGAEDFQGDKIIAALKRVCKGRDVSMGTMAKLARKIEAELIDRGTSSVHSSEIAHAVMRELIEIDSTAFERFAVNYNGFSLEASSRNARKRTKPAEQFGLFDGEAD